MAPARLAAAAARGALDAIAIAPPSAMSPSAIWSVAVWTLDVTGLVADRGNSRRPSHAPAQAAALSGSLSSIVGGWAPTIGGLGVVEPGLIGRLIAFGVPSDDGERSRLRRWNARISVRLATAAGAAR